MLHRFFLLLTILTSFNNILNAQQYKYLTNDEYQHIVWDAIELNDKSLVIPETRWHPQLKELKTFIFKFDSFGHIYDSLMLDHNDFYYNLIWVESLDDDLIFAGMTVDKNDFSTDLLLMKTDTALNIIWDTVFGSSDDDLIQALHVSNDKDIYLSTVRKDTSCHYTFYHLNSEGQIEGAISKEYPGLFWSDIIETPAQDKLIASSVGGNELWIINRDRFSLDTISQYVLPNMGTASGCLANLNDSNFIEIVYAEKFVTPQIPPLNQICLLRRNLQGDTKDYFVINPLLDTSEMTYSGCLHSLATDSIFILSTRGPKIYGHSMFEYDQDSWFSLYSISSNGIIHWNKLYGGNGFYKSTRLLPSNEGGFYLIGNYYDWKDTSSIEQLLIYKVNRDGNLVTSTESESQDNNILKIFPNPAFDNVTLVFDVPESFYKRFSIELYNVQGQKLIAKTMYSTDKEAIIDSKKFQSGIYSVRLIGDGRSITNKKLVIIR